MFVITEIFSPAETEIISFRGKSIWIYSVVKLYYSACIVHSGEGKSIYIRRLHIAYCENKVRVVVYNFKVVNILNFIGFANHGVGRIIIELIALALFIVIYVYSSVSFGKSHRVGNIRLNNLSRVQIHIAEHITEVEVINKRIVACQNTFIKELSILFDADPVKLVPDSPYFIHRRNIFKTAYFFGISRFNIR